MASVRLVEGGETERSFRRSSIDCWNTTDTGDVELQVAKVVRINHSRLVSVSQGGPCVSDFPDLDEVSRIWTMDQSLRQLV